MQLWVTEQMVGAGCHGYRWVEIAVLMGLYGWVASGLWKPVVTFSCV